jgi:diguanylate cyclase (GGDEF)-like protein/PAS domain S-box-containing protein
MSLAVQAETAAGAVAAVAAAAILWRSSTRHEGSVRNSYRWLTMAAVAWGAGFVAQQALIGPLGGTAVPLTLGDLLSLFALPAMLAGLVALAASGAEPAAIRPREAAMRLADGYVLAAALFVIGWIALFGSIYRSSGDGAGTFGLALLHPLADLAVLGVVLPYVAIAGRRGLAPFLALLAVAVSDALAVGAKVDAASPGAWAQLMQLAAFCLLGATPLINSGRLRLPEHRPVPGVSLLERHRQARETGLTALVAALAAAAAALVIISSALAGGSAAGPAVAVTGCIAVLALAARITGLLVRERAVAVTRQESGRQFRELAERITDVVLVCDLDGTIRYASTAVAEYGYSPEKLDGMALADLMHPEDLPGGIRYARAAARSAPAAQRYPCRVRSADGTWRHVESTASRYWDAGEPDQLLVTARDVSDQVALRRQVTHLTFHDGLTGLPNRAYLEQRAKDVLGAAMQASAERQAAGQQSAVAGAIFLDLDGFTGVNDSVGHGAGDLLLAQAARRLRATVPPRDTVARWGGDEFAVLVEKADSAQEIVDIAERLGGAIAAEAFRVADRDVSLTASVGVALADDEEAGYLLRNADVAMSRAKESGGGRVEVFAAHMHADVVRRLELAGDLRRAITERELRLDFQPVMNLATSEITGVEALVRWSRAGEAVHPAEFLDIAEDSGLIVPLGDWVLREACEQAAAWHRSGWAIGVSVNFSSRQVSAPGFTESVLAALDDTGLAPPALTLELTERMLIEGAAPMVEGLAELRRRGINLAIDDFGTGHASLAYLRQLPVDIIKIDPSFVAGLGQDPTLAMLTRTIVRVGHDLGIEVVAEGIERPEQLDLLREMGCGLGQGYLIARPMTAREVAVLARGEKAAVAGGEKAALAGGEKTALAGGEAPAPEAQGEPGQPGEISPPGPVPASAPAV